MLSEEERQRRRRAQLREQRRRAAKKRRRRALLARTLFITIIVLIITGAVCLIKHFKNAKFYMTKTEYENFMSDETSVQARVLTDVKKFVTPGKVVLFDDEMTVDCIKLKKKGGHTKGSMSLEIGKTMFVGDTIFVHENLSRKIPAGYTADRNVSDALLDEYLKYDGKIITSHDINEVKYNV